jgi:hypothetical protein
MLEAVGAYRGSLITLKYPQLVFEDRSHPAAVQTASDYKRAEVPLNTRCKGINTYFQSAPFALRTAVAGLFMGPSCWHDASPTGSIPSIQQQVRVKQGHSLRIETPISICTSCKVVVYGHDYRTSKLHIRALGVPTVPCKLDHEHGHGCGYGGGCLRLASCCDLLLRQRACHSSDLKARRRKLWGGSATGVSLNNE